MRRRELITFLGGTALAWPLGALAQQTGKFWRVGMLDTTPATLNAANIDAFRRGLRQLGYVEGQNLIIEYRSGEGRIERFPELAAEMVRLKVDLIVTRGTPAALAAKNATATIPIVMAAIGEPVGTGMVASLA
jgi:putative tryptophan/tyrosine transport system substrate-binding protein